MVAWHWKVYPSSDVYLSKSEIEIISVWPWHLSLDWNINLCLALIILFLEYRERGIFHWSVSQLVWYLYCSLFSKVRLTSNATVTPCKWTKWIRGKQVNYVKERSNWLLWQYSHERQFRRWINYTSETFLQFSHNPSFLFCRSNETVHLWFPYLKQRNIILSWSFPFFTNQFPFACFAKTM